MPAEIVENRGLICGFAIEADGSATPVHWPQIDDVLESGKIAWLHFNLNDRRTQAWFKHCAHIPALAADTLLGRDHHMRLELIGHGIAGVLGDIKHDFHSDPSDIGVLRLYIDDRRIITARNEPSHSADMLRRALSTGSMRLNSTGDFIVHLLHQVSATLGQVMAELTDTVDTVEDRLLDDKTVGDAAELGRVRRSVAMLRRHIMPQRQVLAGVLGRLPPWLDSDDAAAFRQAIERLAAVGHDLDLIQERAQLLQSELSSRLAENTSRNLYVLSILTAVFLPITLISGIFGMNVAGVPGVVEDVASGAAFWWVVAGMGATVGVTLTLLHWKRLF